MDKKNHSLNKEGFLSKNKTTIIVVSFLILFYASLAISMNNLRPFAVVRSESMVPTLEKGDLILIKVLPIDALKVGDIMVFDVPSPYDKYIPSPVIHRIIKIDIDNGVKYFETKGDNNPTPDFFKIPATNVFGKYAEIKIPFIGHIFLFLQSPVGLVMMGSLIAILIVYSFLDSKKHKTNQKS